MTWDPKTSKIFEEMIRELNRKRDEEGRTLQKENQALKEANEALDHIVKRAGLFYRFLERTLKRCGE